MGELSGPLSVLAIGVSSIKFVVTAAATFDDRAREILGCHRKFPWVVQLDWTVAAAVVLASCLALFSWFALFYGWCCCLEFFESDAAIVWSPLLHGAASFKLVVGQSQVPRARIVLLDIALG
jgi:hypothetical protein